MGVQTDPIDFHSFVEGNESGSLEDLVIPAVEDEEIFEAVQQLQELDLQNSGLGLSSDMDNTAENIDEEEEELDEGDFDRIDLNASSISEESFTDQYLRKIQERLRGGKLPKEYASGDFWVARRDAAFILNGELRNQALKELYSPRVFLWLPHHFKKGLKCVSQGCDNKIDVECFNSKPRARRIIDLNE